MLDHTPIQEKDWWTTNLTCAESSVDQETTTTTDNNNNNNNQGATQDSVEMHFHNRGQQVWEHCRNEWRSYSPPLASPPRKPTKPLSGMQRRAVLSGLSRQREYALPRRIRLEELVGVYQEVWHQDSD